MRTVCVYCGSSPGVNPAYVAAAGAVGRLLASSGRTLVYGGGRVGMMGAVADAALAAGGRVIGVIPRSLVEKELAHRGVTELRIVASMHERKATMADHADAFVALPGGVGTLEEIFEAWTWGQLGIHAKPYGLLDVGGFFSPLLRFLDQVVAAGFIRQEHRDMLLVDTDPAALLDRMERHRPPFVPKWMPPDAM
jgi:uncharacterized protein (TIGR00730 family)